MCTLTLIRYPAGLLLTMNRDESDERSAEVPVQRYQCGKQVALYPKDGEAGGTWMGVNDTKIAICLLNDYSSQSDQMVGSSSLAENGHLQKPVLESNASPSSILSRGAIIPALLACQSMQEIHDNIAMLDTDSYRRFHLVWTDGKNVQSFHSASQTFFSYEEEMLCFSSSSLEQNRIEVLRKEGFDRWVANGKMFDRLLPSFHLMQINDDPIIGPLMKRTGRSTRSITQIDLNEDPASILRYWPHPTGNAGHPNFEGGI